MAEVTIDTPQGPMTGTQAQVDAYRAALKKAGNPTRDAVTPAQPITDEFERADTTTGAPFGVRLGASFKMTKEGSVNFIKHKYGENNVFLDEKDNVYFKKPGDKRRTLFDEKGVSVADVADFAGNIPGVVLSTLGAIGGAATAPFTGPAGPIVGAALGAGAGNAIKQGISASLDGSDQMTPLSRVGSVATDMALGGATQGLVAGGVALRDLVRPGNLVARSAIKASATPYAQRGRDLSAPVSQGGTGIPMSFAEETGSRSAAIVEGTARRNPITADQFAAFEKLGTDKAVERIHGIMNDIHGSEVGDATLGQSAQRAFDKLWDGVVSTRRAQASSDFAEVAKQGGKEALIPVGATKQRLLDLAKEYDVPGGGDATAALAKQIKGVADDIGMMITPDQMNRLLQIYGKASAGKGTIFANLDNAQQRYLAGQVHNALTKDLDTAAANPLFGKASEALKTARDNYATNSAKITEVSDSVIGRYFGVKNERTPERVADTIAKMKPTELRATVGLLQRADPEIADQTARHFLERAFVEARPPAGQTQGGQVTFTAARYLNALPDDKVLEALIGGKPAHGELKKVAEALERVANRPMSGSPTAPMMMTSNLAMMAWDVTKGLFTLNPQALMGLPAAVLAPRAIASASLTPQGRQALITLSKTGKPTKEVLQATSFLTALNVKESNQDASAAIASAGKQ